MSEVIHADHHDDHAHGPAKGLKRWLFTTNHKDIGTLYLWFSFAMFLVGGVLALVIPARAAVCAARVLQPNDDKSRIDYGFRGHHAGLRRFG
jgi:cytochrome c oxidase subunit 1